MSLSKVNKPQPPCAVGSCLTQSLWLPPPQHFSDTWLFLLLKPQKSPTIISLPPISAAVTSLETLQNAQFPLRSLPPTPNSAHSSPPFWVLGSSRVSGNPASTSKVPILVTFPLKGEPHVPCDVIISAPAATSPIHQPKNRSHTSIPAVLCCLYSHFMSPWSHL